MKLAFIASLGLFVTLTGCSSSPSIYEQNKLVEYEKCLTLAQTLMIKDQEARGLGKYTSTQFLDDWFDEVQEFTKNSCSKYKP